MNYNDNQEKTEAPTRHKSDQARKKGQTNYFRELNSFIILICGVAILYLYRFQIFYKLVNLITFSLNFNHDLIKNNSYVFYNIFIQLKAIIYSFFYFFIFIFFIIFIMPLCFNGVLLNFRLLQFSYKNINMIQNLKKIFSYELLMEGFKIILKLLTVFLVCIWYFYIFLLQIVHLMFESSYYVFNHAFNMMLFFLIIILISFIPIIILDVFWKKFIYYKKLKMSLQEVKDEYKEMEGNVNTKMYIREEMKLSQHYKRMIRDVIKSDIVIMNSVKYAVAIQYNSMEMYAPKVLVKGAGKIAIKIKNIALEHNILLLSEPSLAYALYRYADINQYIPSMLYISSSEVLAWVWKFRQWKKEGGIFPTIPKNLSILSK